MDQDLIKALENIAGRLERLEDAAQKLDRDTGKWNNTHMLHPLSTNLSNIREMFLLEIIREKGLLDGVDLNAIEDKVRATYANGTAPWGASEKAALGNLKKAIRELEGDYSSD